MKSLHYGGLLGSSYCEREFHWCKNSWGEGSLLLLIHWDNYSCKGGGVARGYFDIWASLTSVNRANTPPIVATIIKPMQPNALLQHLYVNHVNFYVSTLLFKQATNILQPLKLFVSTTFVSRRFLECPWTVFTRSLPKTQ